MKYCNLPRKLIKDAEANLDEEKANRLRHESISSVREVREIVRKTHNEYVQTMEGLYLVAHPTNRKWVITPVISRLTLLIPCKSLW